MSSKQRTIFIVIDVILAFLVVVALGFLLYYRSDLKECEENESLYCPNYTCSDNKPALRIAKGRKVSTLPSINT